MTPEQLKNLLKYRAHVKQYRSCGRTAMAFECPRTGGEETGERQRSPYWQPAVGCQYGALHGSASSWVENRLTPNGLQRASQGHVRPHLPPFASMTHVCDIELAVAQVLQTCKTGLEKW